MGKASGVQAGLRPKDTRMKRQIDILFATHNGQKTLPRMLHALSELNAPTRPWRIVTVDNASTDGTAKILEDGEARLPLKRLFCPKPGKAAAQIFALPHLQGDLIVLTDDDIIPDPDWLVALEAAADAHPEADIFGGAIEPAPIEPVTDWYAASATYRSDLFGLTTAKPGPVNGADTIFGPNMMLRHTQVTAAFSRPSVLGPTFVQKGRRRVFPMGDESEMIAALERAGAAAYFAPGARVQHMVRRFQTELDFMLQRAQNHGRGVALRAIQHPRNWRKRTQIAASSLLHALWMWPSAVLVSRSSPAAAVFDRLHGFSWHIGRAKGALFGPFAA